VFAAVLKPSNAFKDLILRRRSAVSKDDPIRCGLWRSFETPAAQALQDEVA
jgi:hypothetical protein